MGTQAGCRKVEHCYTLLVETQAAATQLPTTVKGGGELANHSGEQEACTKTLSLALKSNPIHLDESDYYLNGFAN